MHLLRILPHSKCRGVVVCLPKYMFEWQRKDVMRCSVMQLLDVNPAAFQYLLILHQCVVLFCFFKSSSFQLKNLNQLLAFLWKARCPGTGGASPHPQLVQFCHIHHWRKGAEGTWCSVAATAFSNSCVHLKNSELQVQSLVFLFYFLFFMQIPLDSLGERDSGMMISVTVVAHCRLQACAYICVMMLSISVG